jgi:hypothetical protein
MAADTLLLSDLTTSLMREVFKAINDSAVEQTETFIALAAEAGVSPEVYAARAVGSTPAEQAQTADRYLRQVVLPLLGLPVPPATAPLPARWVFGDAGRQALRDQFRDLVVGGKAIDQALSASGDSLHPWAVPSATLAAFALARLLQDARESQAKLSGLLAAGLPSIVVAGGQISTKVTMQLNPPPPVLQPALPFRLSAQLSPAPLRAGAAALSATAAATVSPAPSAAPTPIQVRLANERSLALSRSSVDFVATVTIDFRTSSFPPFSAARAASS